MGRPGGVGAGEAVGGEEARGYRRPDDRMRQRGAQGKCLKVL